MQHRTPSVRSETSGWGGRGITSRRTLCLAIVCTVALSLAAPAEAAKKTPRALGDPMARGVAALIVAELMAQHGSTSPKAHPRTRGAILAAFDQASGHFLSARTKQGPKNAKLVKELDGLLKETKLLRDGFASNSQVPLRDRLGQLKSQIGSLRAQALTVGSRFTTRLAAMADGVALHTIIGEDGLHAASWLQAGAAESLVGDDGIVALNAIIGEDGLLARVETGVSGTTAQNVAVQLRTARHRWQKAGKKKAQLNAVMGEAARANIAALDGL